MIPIKDQKYDYITGLYTYLPKFIVGNKGVEILFLVWFGLV